LNTLAGDPSQDYIADGLTGEIIRNLSIIDGLTVRSQTSSFAFKGKPQNVRDAGKQLDADYILEGSVQRAGQQLRITVQLVRASDDFPLWSGRYDREFYGHLRHPGRDFPRHRQQLAVEARARPPAV